MDDTVTHPYPARDNVRIRIGYGCIRTDEVLSTSSIYVAASWGFNTRLPCLLAIHSRVSEQPIQEMKALQSKYNTGSRGRCARCAHPGPRQFGPLLLQKKPEAVHPKITGKCQRR